MVQIGGRHHPGFVDDQRRPLGQPPHRLRAGGLGPFVEQLRDRVGRHPGLAFQHPRRLRGRRDTEHPTPLLVEIVDRGAKHRGLAGTRRSDHHHQPVAAGDRGSSVGLQHIETLGGDRGRRGGWVELGVEGPGDDRFLLADHLTRRHLRGDGFDPHRPPIRPAPLAVTPGRVKLDALREHPVHRLLHQQRPVLTGDVRAWPEAVRDRTQHIHPVPRRTPPRKIAEHIRDRHRRLLEGLGAGGLDDRGGQHRRGEADSGCFGQPP